MEVKYPSEINLDVQCLHCKKLSHVTVHLELILKLGEISLAYSDREPKDDRISTEVEHRDS